jgi:cytochrome oxidase Cu insertion factor (SCO1/SenC/PrrC family)
LSAEAEINTPTARPAADEAPRASGTAIPFVLSLLLFVAVAYGAWTLWKVHQDHSAQGDAISAGVFGPPIKDFELTERSGKPFRSADMHGRVWVATFFYTSCPGQCLRVNANLQVLNNMPELKDVTWVSISCDPDNDTLAALRSYADRFQADPNRWLFCRGDLEYVQRVAKGMLLYLSLKGHQDRAIVFDKTGKMRGTPDATSEIECNRMHDLLLKLLDEKPSQNLASGSGIKEKSS